MITIREVKTKKDIKVFVDFPTKLYKGVSQYVHPLRMNELDNFNAKKNVSFDDCEAVYFLAYDNKKVVGRIAGIIQRLYNDKTNEKRVRFTRFDSVNDEEVAKKLFESVENWARQKGMNIVHGPMGFNDLDREGMLIEGFDELATFEEQYNFEYYKHLMEKCGYGKEIDWIEFNITVPKQCSEKVARIANAVEQRYNLRVPKPKNKNEFFQKYKADFFKLLDKAYGPLYGVVPYTDKVRDQIISQFKLFISLDYISLVVNEKDELVAFGLAFPSLSRAMNKSKGKLLPFGFIRVLKALRKTNNLDLALIAVDPAYLSKGVNAIIIREMVTNFAKHGITNCETNLMLETNYPIQHMWKNFEHREHKRRRCWVKYLD